MCPRVDDGQNQAAADRVWIVAQTFNSERQLLAPLPRNIKGAKQPIPDGQCAAEIAVEMRRVRRMMDLVVGRAKQQMPQTPA